MTAPARRRTPLAAAMAVVLTGAVLAGGAVVVAGRHRSCVDCAGGGSWPRTAAPDPIGIGPLPGKGSIAPELPAGSRPSAAPAQAGDQLRGRALPTNQWWTSALTGPWSQPLYAHPLAIRATPAGLEVSGASVQAQPNTVLNPFRAALTVGGPQASVRVTDYGAFSVRLQGALTDGGRLETTLVQGSPLLFLRFHGTPPRLTAAGPVELADGGSRARIQVDGHRFDVVAAGAGRWQRSGQELRLTGGGADPVLAAGLVPDGADQRGWLAALRSGAANPVLGTTATAAYDGQRGQVVQRLRLDRARAGAGPFALLPHQQRTLDPAGAAPFPGGYPEPLGTLRLVAADEVTLRVPMPGLLPGVPALPAASRAAVAAGVRADLAQPAASGGSYFGLKEVGRLATAAEMAAAAGDTAAAEAARGRLRGELVDWLTYRGPGDARYFGYDRAWGGLVAVPAEFGSQDYNDHHFQYGYLLRAAAVLAAADPQFARDYRPVVDLIVRDYAGGGPGLPADRAFSPYLGHSLAAGFAAFADGNNQESSSEAVAAWDAAVRWGAVTGQPDLVDLGTERYALEALTARMYWLGDGLGRPPGYAHRSAGVVWDGKIDFATFFDPRPEAVLGIQLLPLTFGSLYRADPAAARQRVAELAQAGVRRPRIWADLFAADLAAADPAAAAAQLSRDPPREPSTSRAIVRGYLAVLAAYGPPDGTVTADSPYGLALRGPRGLHLLATNPTSQARTVVFRRGGEVLGTIHLDPGQAQTVSAG